MATSKSKKINPFSLATISSPRVKSNTKSLTRDIVKIKAGESMNVRFLVNPWDSDGSDWRQVWIVGAWDGLIGDYEMPQSMKDFPVNVAEWSETAGGWVPLPWGSDPYLEMVKPSSKFTSMTKSGIPRPTVSPRLLINVLDEEGNHKILNITRKQGESLANAFVGYQTEFPDYQVAGKLYNLSISADYEISVKIVDATPLSELPEYIDLNVRVNEWRNEAVRYIDSLVASEDASDEDVLAVNDEEVTSFEEAVSSKPNQYHSYKDDKLKALLRDAGVEFPENIARASLIELANKSLN